MKVAILLSGHVRSYKNTRDNIFNNLVTPLRNAGYTCDIFSSVWSNCGYRENSWQGVADIDLLASDSVVIECEDSKRDEFIHKYNSDKWMQYSHLSGRETCGDAVSMWYKVWRSYMLSLKDRHDIIIRVRPDIVFDTVFDISTLEKIASNTIYMSNWHGKYEVVTYKMMDHFAFGDFESMTKYCSIYPCIDTIIERDDTAFTAEGFLYSQIRNNNLQVIRVPIKYGVMRSHGVENVA